MDKKFLITYDSDKIYKFFSEDGEEYTVDLFLKLGENNFSKVFETATIEIDESENEYYVREIVDASLKTEEFILDGFEESSKVFSLLTDGWVAYYDDESFALIESENLNYTFDVQGGQATISIDGPIDEQIIVQFAYYCGFALVEGETYKVSINGEPIELEAGIKDDNLYLGDYDYFLRSDSGEPVEPTEEDIQIGDDRFIEIDSYVIYSEEEEKKYKITFGEVGADSEEFIVVAGQMLDAQQRPAAFVGNLNVYNSERTDTGEPFFIYTVWTDSSNMQEGYTSWLYVRDPGSYNLKVEPYKINKISSLKGAAIVSFGNLSNGILSENYGIGVNSSDQNLTLPQRAISLFETQLGGTTEEPNNKISFKYRGILGTLPNSLEMYDGIKPSMTGTQGIYTDNMYIGNKDQYVAFYRDKDNDYQGKLDIKGTFHIGDGTLNGIVDIESGGISLGDPNKFHIFIDGNSSEQYTYGLGFYDGPHNPYQLSEDSQAYSDKEYYEYDEDTEQYTKVIPQPGDNPKEEGWYEYKDRRVAYINSNKLNIPYTVVLKGMDLGESWRWELQEDTKNLTLKWMGGENNA